MTTLVIPSRSLFKAPEVCQIAGVQPYVLRSWESEFPDLGVSRRDGSQRVYRRSDVERVLRIRHLVFVEGLTLAGARRRLGEEPRSADQEGPPLDELLGRDARERLQQVRDGLREVLQILSRRPHESGNGEPPFELRLVPGGCRAPARVAAADRRRTHGAASAARRAKKPARRARR